jgi:hypothetical protein
VRRVEVFVGGPSTVAVGHLDEPPAGADGGLEEDVVAGALVRTNEPEEHLTGVEHDAPVAVCGVGDRAVCVLHRHQPAGDLDRALVVSGLVQLIGCAEQGAHDVPGCLAIGGLPATADAVAIADTLSTGAVVGAFQPLQRCEQVHVEGCVRNHWFPDILRRPPHEVEDFCSHSESE